MSRSPQSALEAFSEFVEGHEPIWCDSVEEAAALTVRILGRPTGDPTIVVDDEETT